MYFVISPNSYTGHGTTLYLALQDLSDVDPESHDLINLDFYKAEKIDVTLQEIVKPVKKK